MTSRPIWMPLYCADYLADTRHLTTIQHGGYMLLLMEYWMKGKLPDTDAGRRRITAMTAKQWSTNRSDIASMFGPDWRHDRVERELEKAKELRTKRSVYGSKGGRISRGRDNVERFVVVHNKPTKSST